MLFGICPWIEVMLTTPEVRQLTLVAPTIVSYFPSPVIVILSIATNPTALVDKVLVI